MAYTDNMEKKLQIIFGDVTFGVKGEDFQYIFSYQGTGILLRSGERMAVPYAEADVLACAYRQ